MAVMKTLILSMTQKSGVVVVKIANDEDIDIVYEVKQRRRNTNDLKCEPRLNIENDKIKSIIRFMSCLQTVLGSMEIW